MQSLGLIFMQPDAANISVMKTGSIVHSMMNATVGTLRTDLYIPPLAHTELPNSKMMITPSFVYTEVTL